ncbi:SH3 domain-containing protein, partial [bacterium]
MFYGICHFSVVPVRCEPSDKSELVTQLLFGEAYEILEHRDKWLQIRMAEDGYTGFIDAKQHTEITEEYYQSFVSVRHPRCSDWVAAVSSDNEKFLIGFGSVLP